MSLNDPGCMVVRWWQEIAHNFPGVIPVEPIVMPDHFHGFIEITGDGSIGADLRVRPSRPSSSEIVQWFKTMNTNEYIRWIRNNGWAGFHGRVWQRNFYEHIVRNAAEYQRVVPYIQANPSAWQADGEDP